MIRATPTQYLAYVQRAEPIGFIATLPDFPGCQARAPSWLQIEDAVRMAVKLHVEHMDTVPPPTPIEEFTEDSAPPNACWMLVSLFLHEVRPTEEPVKDVRRGGPRVAVGGSAPRTMSNAPEASIATR